MNLQLHQQEKVHKHKSPGKEKHYQDHQHALKYISLAASLPESQKQAGPPGLISCFTYWDRNGT